MRSQHLASLLAASAVLLGAAPVAPQPVSSWVYVGPDNRLHYKTDAQGNRILDFSSAGYRGGGIALPVLSVAATVPLATGDATAAIQAAIDTVSKSAPGTDGFRGAVLLQPGTYQVSGTLRLAVSGVALRGSGSGSGGTVLDMTGTAHLAFAMGGAGSRQDGASVAMTDAYVPSGATSFNVSDASGLKVGDSVIIGRPVTQPWVHFMGMDTLVDSTGKAQTWINVGSVIETDRTIAAVSGNAITLDAPLADSFDATYVAPPGGTVRAYTFPGRVSDVGVEHLSVVAPAVDVIISSPQFTGATLDTVIDAWISDVQFQDTQNTVTVNNGAKRVTIDGVHVTHTVTHTGDRMADFGLSGTQVLVNKSSSDGTGEWPLLTQAQVSGPIVALNFTSTEQAGIGPHQRWAVGLLADNASLPNAPNNYDGGATGISYSDRGNHGSGQGWAMGWGVAWNVTTPHLVVQQPPGSQSWCIGCVGAITTATEAGSGKPVPNGVFESVGTKVTPNSLYLAQLCDRLGPAALVNIGYTAADCAVPSAVGTGADAGADGSTPPGGGGGDQDAGQGGGPGGVGGGGADGGPGAGPGGGGAGATGSPPADATASPRGCACAMPGSSAPRSDGAYVLAWIAGVLALALRRVRARASAR